MSLGNRRKQKSSIKVCLPYLNKNRILQNLFICWKGVDLSFKRKKAAKKKEKIRPGKPFHKTLFLFPKDYGIMKKKRLRSLFFSSPYGTYSVSFWKKFASA